MEQLHPDILAKLQSIVERQQINARFVIMAPMLGVDTVTFDRIVKTWVAQGGPGFVAEGIPFRKVIDGQFFIQRLTVRRVAEEGEKS